MEEFIILFAVIFSLGVGAILGYFARQSIARKQVGSIEEKLRSKIEKVKKDSQEIIEQAKEKAAEIIRTAQREQEERQKTLLKREETLLEREKTLDKRATFLEEKERKFDEEVEELKKIKEKLDKREKELSQKLEKIARMNKEEAKKILFDKIEKEYQTDLLERIKKLEKEGEERYERKAKEILASVIQRIAVPQAQEISTTVVPLPSDELKGRIIGKEGRNIRTFEKETGVELIVDDTPGILVISSFDPVRREVAKIALEKLMKDGRIQPARIEEVVKESQEEIEKKIKEAGEMAEYETGILDLDPALVKLLGRLRFRVSYGQNVLLHSIETSLIAGALAEELGADVWVAKKAGLLHDIGKALDHNVEGSHVDIGIKILEKYNVEPDVIKAMKSHHGDYPVESLEAVIVQVADAISAARPGARKDTVENYLKRLESLEKIALSFKGVEKAWALQAGREIRVFVKPEEIDDLKVKRLAREIVDSIQKELRYPGEIKVTVIRETRVVEYAK